MAWSYRKRIKIVPGVHLNFSKRGISTSIGIKGASLNFSSSGTRLNTNVLGFSNSYNISKSSSQRSQRSTVYLPPISSQNRTLSDNIFSADIQEITSQDMSGIKESILMAQKQKAELETDLQKIKKALTISKTKKMVSYIFIYGLSIKIQFKKSMKILLLKRRLLKKHRLSSKILQLILTYSLMILPKENTNVCVMLSKI